MPIKVTDASSETVTFTHFHVKSFTVTQAAAQGAPYRIDIVGKRYGVVGQKRVYDAADIVYTCQDFVPLAKEVLVDIDGIDPGQVNQTIAAALNATDKGNIAEGFAGMLMLIGKVMHHVNAIQYDKVEA